MISVIGLCVVQGIDPHPQLSREHHQQQQQQPAQNDGIVVENAVNADDSDSDDDYVLEVSDEE
jgi:hypothetical protein